MMKKMNDEEIRVLGCLLEKSVITPEQYPLTLNALTNACNQKSSRNPVMSMEPGAVQRAVLSLQAKRVVTIDENFRKQTEKYSHRFCNTPFSDYQFDEAQLAAVCVLLLRGTRTPGEIRANSGRLHTFADNEAVVETLQSLLDYEGGPLVAMLPRTPGRRDAEFVHLFGEVVEAAEPPATVVRSAVGDLRAPTPTPSTLAARVEHLEAEVQALKRLIHSITDAAAE